MNNLKHVTFLTLLGLTLSLSNQVWGSDHNVDDLYQKAQEIRHSNNMTTDSLPLSYFEALDHAASAGSTKAKEELQSYSHYVTHPSPMTDGLIWGGTPQANEQIRNIFKKWAPKKIN